MSDLQLTGGGREGAVLRGDRVIRRRRPWSDTVEALLRHLEDVGYPYAPRVAAATSETEEALLFVDGEQASQWTDAGIRELGTALRLLHEATATFAPGTDASWQEGWWTRSRRPGSVIGHGDPGPWNVIERDGQPVALVDWEFAGPVDRLEEVAHAAWLNCQLHDDDVAERQGLLPAEERAHQVRLFLDGYALESTHRRRFVDLLIEVAVLSAANDAVDAGVTPETTDATGIWGLAWRVRSGAWIARHRQVLASAILD
jgi:aminoglycoside phosphotransferase (APT) family kinase protein